MFVSPLYINYGSNDSRISSMKAFMQCMLTSLNSYDMHACINVYILTVHMHNTLGCFFISTDEKNDMISRPVIAANNHGSL